MNSPGGDSAGARRGRSRRRIGTDLSSAPVLPPPGYAELAEAVRSKPLKSGCISAASQAQRLVTGGHRPADPLISKAPSGGLVQSGDARST
jgi:hypothetical protein